LSESVHTVERALDVLSCFNSSSPELSMTQISEKVGIHKSTVHRLLATLEAKRFVQRDPISGLYSPGKRLLQLAYLCLNQNNLVDIAPPFMRQLHDLHRETITLSVLDELDVVYVDVLESQQSVKLAARPGQRLPAFCTASGKVLLAHSSLDVVQKIFDQKLPAYTSHTIRDFETMRHVFKLACDRGFAYSEQEYEEGINAVAAPILDGNQRPVAAIAVAGPAYRLPVEIMLQIGPSIVVVANEMTRELATTSPARKGKKA
jgi:IclR family KDG regulon transcriptional repressor